jgi:hypothetical protein
MAAALSRGEVWVSCLLKHGCMVGDDNVVEDEFACYAGMV